jgi:hypothetical protein
MNIYKIIHWHAWTDELHKLFWDGEYNRLDTNTSSTLLKTNLEHCYMYESGLTQRV